MRPAAVDTPPIIVGPALAVAEVPSTIVDLAWLNVVVPPATADGASSAAELSPVNVGGD